MFSRWAIRTRITVGSIAVAAVLLLAALLVVRAQVAATLTAADISLAQGDLTSFERDISANPDEPVDDPGTGVLVLVRDPAGTAQVDTLPHDVRDLVADRAARDEEFTTKDDEGRTFVVVGRAVATPSGSWALWSARSTSSSELALEGLDRVLMIGGAALLVGFGVASWLLATLALRPVTAMRQRAEELEQSDSDGLLPVSRARDELAELATTLNSLLARVRGSSAREKQMVSDAAHELRTPLAVLKTQLELAHRDHGDAAALGRQLAAAELSVDRLAALASNLLELSRLEAHDSNPVATAETLADEFTAGVDRARTLAVGTNTGIEFELVLPDPLASYRMDAQAFGRLVDNLISNALNALDGRGAVTAALTQTEHGLVLRVADDGPGMPADFIPVAFDRFTRPDTSRGASTGGSGLGLALVRALARDAGGDASIANLKPGLAVTVALPKI